MKRARLNPGRTESLTLRLTAEERRMLDAVATAWGVSASDVVRMQVRKAYESGGVMLPPLGERARAVPKAVRK